jgi:hypothetical protein
MTDNPSSTALTPDEQQLVRRSAFGAIALVSRADPGFFAMFKESMAGSKAMLEAPPEVQALLREGGFPTPPTGSSEEIERSVMQDLRSAMSVLQAKAPGTVGGYREVILAAADRVAGASDGVAPEETAVIEKIRSALSTGVAGEPSVGDRASDAPRHD